MKYRHFLLGLLLLVWQTHLRAASNSHPAIIPLPQKMELLDSTFTLNSETKIAVDDSSRETGQYLATQLRQSTGFKIPLVEAEHASTNEIMLTTKDAKRELGPEGYELTVNADSAIIHAPAATGLFYGVQSLLQLLPPQIFATNTIHDVAWTIPCVRIEDQPQFPWRGFMLDVSRHFFSKAEVEKVLDLMALHKLNMFHWHLVDEDGWRIEITKYPRLTDVAAWRNNIGFGFASQDSTTYGPDGRYGGYYTKAGIREVVAYAAARHIEVVPEIEMPGHSTAALAAYPELSCEDKPYSIDRGPGHRAGVYCAGNDASFVFLQDVLSEVFELFPSKYIHVGGDEVEKRFWKACPKCQARMKTEGLKNENELQSYFIRRMEKFINSKGKTMIGWSEISEGGLATNAVVMDWIGGGLEAASSGHDVVMTPLAYSYFNFYQVKNHEHEPKAFGSDVITLKQTYSFDPVPDKLPLARQSHILGAQGNLWAEYIANLPRAEFMMFPRVCALAEVVWRPKSERNYTDFLSRLPVQFERFDELGVSYRRGNNGKIGE